MTTIEKRLSLVVPVFNRAALVGRLLSSFQSHAVLPAHIVLVDNNSTDGTPEVLGQYAAEIPTKVTVLGCTTPGACAARNVGLAVVDTPWVMFFDSDDEMGPQHTANISRALDALPHADIIGWDCPGDDGLRKFFDRDVLRRCLFNGGMATQRWCARTELVRRVGAWDEDVPYWNDIELGTRMLAADPVVHHIGRADVYLHCLQDSITGAGNINPRASDAALERIEATLAKKIGPEKAKFRVALKRVIEYANLKRSNLSTENDIYIDKQLNINIKAFGIWPKTLLRLAYQTTKHRLRGAWIISYFYI